MTTDPKTEISPANQSAPAPTRRISYTVREVIYFEREIDLPADLDIEDEEALHEVLHLDWTEQADAENHLSHIEDRDFTGWSRVDLPEGFVAPPIVHAPFRVTHGAAGQDCRSWPDALAALYLSTARACEAAGFNSIERGETFADLPTPGGPPCPVTLDIDGTAVTLTLA